MTDPTFELIAYRDAEGREPFQVWFAGLDRHAEAKVAVTLKRLEQGNLSEVKSVGLGVLERRIAAAQERWADYKARRNDEEATL